MNVKKILFFAIGPIVSALISLAILPLLTWIYTPEDIGRLSMLNVAVSFAVLIFSLGLDQAFVREYHESNDKPLLFKLSLLPGMVLLSLVITFFLVLQPSLLSEIVVGLKDNSLSYYIAIYILSMFSIRFFALILRMQGRGIAFSMSQVLPKLLILSGIVLLILSEYYDANIRLLIMLYTGSVIAALTLLMWLTRSVWLPALKVKVDWGKCRELLSFGLPLVLGGAAFWGLTVMDKVFLRKLSSFEELGVYSVAVSFAGAAIIIQSVFSTVWAPTVYKWASENKNLDKIGEITNLMLGLVVFVFCIAGLFSWLVKYFLPSEYTQVPYLLVTCMGYPLLYTLSECTVVGIGVMKRTSLAMVSAVIALLVNLVGNYVLIPVFGAAGAAISTAISFFVFLVVRTEFSALVWQPIKRKKLYFFSSLCVSNSILFTLFGSENEYLFMTIWFSLLLFSLKCWENDFRKLIVSIFYFKSS